MKLHADPRTHLNTVTACAVDQVSINGLAYRRSLLLLPDRVDADWGPASFSGLMPAHVEAIAATPADVILLGTGLRQRFPHPALLRVLFEAGRGVEVMDTAAACRTYNILVAEGRHVAAALIIESSPPEEPLP